MNAPSLDPRTSEDILAEVRRLFREYLPEIDFPEASRPAGAVLRIFSEMTSRLIERLNRAPEKHRIAFLNFMNMDVLNPRPARTAMVFRPVRGVDSVFVAGATELSVQGRGLRTFRTMRDLHVAPARLSALLYMEPDRDAYRDLTETIESRAAFYPGGRSVGKDRELEHVLRLGLLNLFPPAHRDEVPLTTRRATPVRKALLMRRLKSLEAAAKMRVYLRGENLDEAFFARWSMDGKNLKPLVYRRGDRIIAAFSEFKLPALTEAQERWDFWLRVRPGGGVSPASRPAAFLPMLRDARYGFQSRRRRLSAMFANTTLLSSGKAFKPFGELPAAGDALYLGDDAFQWQGALVVISARVGFVPAANADAVLVWEYWDGEDWMPLGKSAADGRDFAENKPLRFRDGSRAFTANGTIRFRCPPMGSGKFNGRETFWVRAVLDEGNYGVASVPSKLKRVRDGLREIAPDLLSAKDKHAILAKVAAEPDAKQTTPATLSAPVLKTLKIKYSVRDIPPDALAARNGFQEREIGIASGEFMPFQPFHPIIAPPDTSYLYMGFDNEKALPGAEVSMLCAFDPSRPRPGVGPGGSEAPGFTWEYLGEDRWRPLSVRAENDERTVFNRGDIVRFVLPGDAAPMIVGGTAKDRELFWIRIGAADNAWKRVPLCAGFFPNTVFALNAARVRDEILGSSAGRPHMRVRLAHAPVPGRPLIRVREPVRPGREELEALENELRMMYDSPPPDALITGPEPGEYWIAWIRVKNFALSGPGDRHYTLDSQTGEIAFGDGRRGRPPPSGTRNIRADYYHGGGAAGNLPAKSRVSANRHIPGIESVLMPIASSGGADREEPTRALRRAPGMLRTGGAALTHGDFREMALAYSDAVHRAHCAPMDDGRIRVVVLASDAAGEPPGPGFLIEVEQYLRRRSSPLLARRLYVTEPEFVRVDIRAHVEFEPPGDDHAVAGELRKRLRAWLDPVSGGREGKGRELGDDVSPLDINNLILGRPPVRGISLLNVIGYRASRAVSAPGLIRGETELAVPGRIEIIARESRDGGGASHVLAPA